jgi:hypothetical protein
MTALATAFARPTTLGGSRLRPTDGPGSLQRDQARRCSPGTATLGPCPWCGRDRLPMRSSGGRCCPGPACGRSRSERPGRPGAVRTPQASARTSSGCVAACAVDGCPERVDSRDDTAAGSDGCTALWPRGVPRTRPLSTSAWEAVSAAAHGRRRHDESTDGSGSGSSPAPTSGVGTPRPCTASQGRLSRHRTASQAGTSQARGRRISADEPRGTCNSRGSDMGECIRPLRICAVLMVCGAYAHSSRGTL